jgi:ABC-2 type transport system permease protein
MLERVLDPIRLYLIYSKYTAKSLLQYRLDACFRIFAVLCKESASVIVVYLSLKKFDTLNGWKMNEILFLFSFLYVTYSIMLIFFTGLKYFSYIVQYGELDRLLVRPRGVLFQVLSVDTDFLASIGHGTVGIVLFFNTATHVGVNWDISNILYCVSVIFGGVMIQSALFLLFSCASFYFVMVNNLQNFLFYNTRKFAGYPISIFPGFIQKAMIFLVPFAFVNYFPTEYLLHKTDLAGCWGGVVYLTPVVGICLYAIAYGVWRISLGRYASSGT